jgi:sporulation protein YlmC with PRC-barrel domain
MSTKNVRIDLMVGRMVHDREGKRVGRISEVRVEPQADALEVVEYHLGAAAMLGRIGLTTRRLVGLSLGEPIRVPWQRIDISDPEHPVFDGLADELKG